MMRQNISTDCMIVEFTRFFSKMSLSVLYARISVLFTFIFRRCRAVCGRDGLTFRIIVVKFFPPMILSLGSQLAYTFALSYLTTSMASALTPPAVATSYLLSWAFLKQRLLTVKVSAQ